MKNTMTIEDIKLKVSIALRTTVQNVESRVIGLRLGDSCDRCGGCGEYSFCPQYGTTCFQCGGKGNVVSNTRAGWARIAEKASATPNSVIEEYISDLKKRQIAKVAFKTFMSAWRAANLEIGMPKSYLDQNAGHTAFNEVAAKFSDKLMKLEHEKNSHNELLLILEAGLKAIEEQKNIYLQEWSGK